MMPNTQAEIEELISSLRAWDDAEVLISKEEKGDRDQTVLKLSDISLTNNGETIDGYFAPLSLQLSGDGRTIMEDTDVPLPSGTYNIPMNELHDAHFDGMRLYVTTDRGSYTISRM